MTTDVGVVELRQYTLEPGRRDVLIDLFERNLIEPQEDAGMRVLGHFRDRGDPNRFVWLRGFRDLASRKAGLEAFYGSDLWQEHRAGVNETIVDSDDVLLLRPATESAFGNGVRSFGGGGLFTATIWPFAEPVSAETVGVFTGEIAPELEQAGALPVALLLTEPSDNDFPALPVREGENVVVWLARIEDVSAYEARARALDRSLEPRLGGPPQRLWLVPAARSRLA